MSDMLVLFDQEARRSRFGAPVEMACPGESRLPGVRVMEQEKSHFGASYIDRAKNMHNLTKRGK